MIYWFYDSSACIDIEIEGVTAWIPDPESGGVIEMVPEPRIIDLRDDTALRSINSLIII